MLYAMEQAIAKGFIKENCRKLYFVSDNLNDLFAYLETPAEEIKSVKELKDG